MFALIASLEDFAFSVDDEEDWFWAAFFEAKNIFYITKINK